MRNALGLASLPYSLQIARKNSDALKNVSPARLSTVVALCKAQSDTASERKTKKKEFGKVNRMCYLKPLEMNIKISFRMGQGK